MKDNKLLSCCGVGCDIISWGGAMPPPPECLLCVVSLLCVLGLDYLNQLEHVGLFVPTGARFISGSFASNLSSLSVKAKSRPLPTTIPLATASGDCKLWK